MGDMLPDDYETQRVRPSPGAGVLVVASAIGLIVCLIAYFTPHGPIAHSWGALLVLVSTALMVVASLLVAFTALPRWFFRLLQVLIVLDILGTGVCAYFLEAYVLLAFMVIALLGWLLHVWRDRPRISAT
jgi:hypothetical protein